MTSMVINLLLAVLYLFGTAKCDEDQTKNLSCINNTTSKNKFVVEVYEDELTHFAYNCSELLKSSVHSNHHVVVKTEDISIGGIWLNNNSLVGSNVDCVNGMAQFQIKGGHLGITNFNILFVNGSSTSSFYNVGELSLHVLRRITLFDELAVFLMGPLILINKCAFGAKIEVDMLKRIITQPIELALCLLTQFVLLPLTAVGLGSLFQLDQVLALALLVSAVCPGGGGGYVFSFLVDGDITLAITASLISTLFAMVAMPVVIGFYSYFVHIPNNIVIPYIKILLMLLAIATPISVGMILRQKKPHLAKKLITVIKPLSLFLIFAGLVVAIVTSKYVVYGPKVGYIIAILVPLFGMCIAIFLCKLTCMKWPLTKAVALESGLKNTVLGIAVIELSFPQPQADLASILIIMITVGQVVVAMLWYFIHAMKKCFTSVPPEKEDNGDPLETEMFLPHSSSEL